MSKSGVSEGNNCLELALRKSSETRPATSPTTREKSKGHTFQPVPPTKSKGTGSTSSRGGRLEESKHPLSSLPFTSRTIDFKNKGLLAPPPRSLGSIESTSRPLKPSSRSKQDNGGNWSVEPSVSLAVSPTEDLAIDSNYFSKPPLINRFSRTKGAEMDPDSQVRSSVDRIGSNYTPPATKLAFSADGIICVNVKQWRELSARKIIAGTKFVLAASVADRSIGKAGFESQGWRLSFPLSDVAGNRISMDMDLGRYNRPSGRTSDILFQEKDTALKLAEKRKVMVQSQGAAQNSASRVAYEWYLVNGISSSSVAAPSPSLHFHLLANLPDLSQLRALPSDEVEALMRELFDEVRQIYQHSIKKSILDYMLRNEVTRQRVGIESVPHNYIDYHWWEWGSYKLKFSVTAEYNNMKRPTFHTELCRQMQSVEYGLKWMDNLTLSIRNLWGKYEGLLLVDVPATDEEVFGMKWSSLEISQFQLRQEEAAKVFPAFCEEGDMAPNPRLVVEIGHFVLLPLCFVTKHFMPSSATCSIFSVRNRFWKDNGGQRSYGSIAKWPKRTSRKLKNSGCECCMVSTLCKLQKTVE